jgi:hypothetical protein
VHKSAVEAGKRAAVIVVAALALTLPLRSQQSVIGDSSEAPGSGSQAATAASKQTHLVDLDPTAVKKRIEQPAEKTPLDPTNPSRRRPASSSIVDPGEPRPSTDCTGESHLSVASRIRAKKRWCSTHESEVDWQRRRVEAVCSHS